MDEGINSMVNTIKELEAENEKLKFRLSNVMLSLPDFEERNNMMHEICETGQKVGGMIIIDEAAIRLLWHYDKWLQNRIGLKGNGA